MKHKEESEMFRLFEWINRQLLKMEWLEQIVAWLIGDVFGVDPASPFFQGTTFFVYDVVKIMILLSVLIFFSSYLQSYFTPEKTRKTLSKVKGIGANVIGALLGTVTPFCSCSSIPIFIGFTKAGLPIGVSFSFLISSPLVDLASVLLLATIFNWRIALAYVIVGLIIAVIGGTLIGAFKMERYVEKFVLAPLDSAALDEAGEEVRLTKSQRVHYALDQVKEILQRVWRYILLGVGVGALIHGYIPQAWIESILGDSNPFSVLLATLIGVPMYADIFGTLPIAEALTDKGVGIGTVLAFMMAVTALSLPSLIMLKKVIQPKLLLMFVGVIVGGIVIMGYLFNAIGFLFLI